MIGCFPTPYPDELLYSILARLSARMHFPSDKMFIKELFGTNNIIAVVDLPSHLDALVTNMPHDHGYTVDDIIDAHTLLPYYACFLPTDRLSRLRADMHGSNGPSIHMRAGIMASSVRITEYLKLCMQCIEEDRKDWGECYWHRSHQLPGVEVCSIHALVLQESDRRANNTRTRYTYITAEHVKLRTPYRISAFRSDFAQILIDLARSAAWLLQWCGTSINLHLLRQQYLLVLTGQGFATSSGRLHAGKLLMAFRNYYSDQLLTAWGCGLDQSIADAWLLRLLRRPDTAQHPLKHLLLIHFLGYTVENFILSLPTSITAHSQMQHSYSGNYQNRQSDTTLPPEVLEEKRSAWMRLLDQHPDAGVTALRNVEAGLYMWLYRHDHTWMREHTPPRQPMSVHVSRVDWAKRDQFLAKAIPDAARMIRQSPDRPQQVSTAELGKMIGALPLIQKHADKLPLTLLAIAAEIETREAFAVRRIHWASDLYGSEGKIPKRWELIRRSGVARTAEHPLVQAAIEAELRRLASKRLL